MFSLLAAGAVALPALIAVCCSNPQPSDLPCDIYAAHGTPCVTAHSTTRLLKSDYDGPLYRLVRDSDGAHLDIYPDRQGYADAAEHDAFSKGELCRISVIFDQSGLGNDLIQAAPGTFKGPDKGEFNTLPIADMAPVLISGRKAYGVYIIPGMGFRCNNARGLAIEDEPEGIYYVVDGTHYDSGCCFDYGNSSTNGRAVGTGTMETTYFGTSTNWGSGNGDGPWIMADMEGGLFSGYGAKKNDVPSVKDWRFVSVFVNGGGGNRWDLRGGDATTDSLITYYSGIRPGSKDNDAYFPMHKKGAVLLGNGGDNGNGSSGTFYEGVMTSGYPDDEAIALVQSNIAKAAYREYPLSLSRVGQLLPGEKREFSVAFTAGSDRELRGLQLSAVLPEGWSIEGTGEIGTLEPNGKAVRSFTLTAPQERSSGELRIVARWKGGQAETVERISCSEAVKINEILLCGEDGDLSAQFIELYNASEAEVEVSGLELVARHSGKAPLTIYRFPQGSKLPAGGFKTVRLAGNAATAPAQQGEDELLLLNPAAAGSELTFGGKAYRIAAEGKPASPATTVFIPVSTGPWLDFPAGTTTLPLRSVQNLEEGDMLGIDLGGKYEVVRLTRVGTPALQTSVTRATTKGDTIIDVDASSTLRPGDLLTISTGDRMEKVRVKKVLKYAEPAPARWPGMPFTRHEPGTIELESGLQYDHIAGVDLSCEGSGVSFEPALKYAHRSGDEVRPLGRPYKLAVPLECALEEFGSPQEGLFAYALSPSAGSLSLVDPQSGAVLDAVVYGSRQSDSSANGTVASPELAVMASPQDGGGNIAVVPQDRFFPGLTAKRPAPLKALVRYPDGKDSDNLRVDLQISGKASPDGPNAVTELQ